MFDISVAAVAKAVVVTFRWNLDDPPDAPLYVMPLTTMRADPVLCSDALITRLDFLLDTPRWRDEHTYGIGNDVRATILPVDKEGSIELRVYPPS